MSAPPAIDNSPKSRGDSVVAMLEKSSTLETSSNGSRERVAEQVLRQGNETTFSFVMTMVGLCLALIVAELTPLFIASCYSLVAFALNADEYLAWMTIGYYISQAAITPFSGSLSDIFGRRGVMLFGLAITVISCIICGTSSGFPQYITGQVILGIGSGILQLTVIAANSELVPAAQRGRMFGFVVLGLFPFAPSPLYGQLMTIHSWKYIYLLIGLTTLLSAAILYVFYHPPVLHSELTKRERIARIDWGGALLSISGILFLTIGINWGGQEYPWSSSHVLGMVITGGLLLVIFVLYERFVTKHPMFPSRLVRSPRHFAAVCGVGLFSGINYVPTTAFWVLQVYCVYGASYVQAGVWLLPLGFCIFGGCVIGAMSVTAFKRQVPWVLLLFCIAQTVGTATLAVTDPNNVNTVWAPLIFGLVGMGGVVLPNQVLFSAVVPDDLIATSVALSCLIRTLGFVVGKSMFFNIFAQQLKTAIVPLAIQALEYGVPYAQIETLVTAFFSGPFESFVPMFPVLDTPEKVQTLVMMGHEEFAKVFPLIYEVSIPFGVLACFCCVALVGIDRFLDDHVAMLL